MTSTLYTDIAGHRWTSLDRWTVGRLDSGRIGHDLDQINPSSRLSVERFGRALAVVLGHIWSHLVSPHLRKCQGVTSMQRLLPCRGQKQKENFRNLVPKARPPKADEHEIPRRSV